MALAHAEHYRTHTKMTLHQTKK